jgi:predicted short-subunit dehydrogenase-like oxidoreductase (DUF2520 family)
MIEHDATIAIVGAGAMGTAIARGANAAGRRITAVASRHPSRTSPLADEFGAILVDTAADAAQHADVLILCVPDDAIGPVATSLHDVANKLVVHTAGAKGLEVLQAPADQGAHTGSLHPVMVVAAGGRGHIALRGATAAVDGGTVACRWLMEFARDLHMEPVRIPAEHRALYHLSAAMVGGLMTGLLASAVDLWAVLGLDREIGATAMGRMVQEAGRNLERLGVPEAVMGPAVRGDAGTIEQHLRVLAVEAPQLVPLYRVLVERCLPYAQERGVLSDAQIQSVMDVLEPRDSGAGSRASTDSASDT